MDQLGQQNGQHVLQSYAAGCHHFEGYLHTINFKLKVFSTTFEFN